MMSNFRFRDCIIKPEDLIEYAHELGHTGVFITDHESTTSHINCLDYYDQIKDKPEYENFLIGFGNEIYLCPSTTTAENFRANIYPHFILLALDAEGHKGIRELSTIAWTKNSFMSSHMRVPTYYSDLEDIMQNYQGHMIGANACLGGSLPKHILQFRENNSQQIWNECVDWIEYINSIFGQGYFFLELQPGLTEEQIYVNQKLIELSQITGVNYIISCDSHYLRKEDREVHKAFLNAEDNDRGESDIFYESTYLMSEEEIHERMDSYLGYDIVQTGIDNTMLIYNKLTYYDLRKPLHIPYIPLNTDEPDKDLYEKYVPYIPLYKDLYESEYDCDRHLLRRLLEYMEEDPYYRREEAYYKVNEALDYLLRSSDKMNVRWSAYLLQVSDYVDIAWKAGTLVGCGRGSGIGFCLLYMLKITQVDPLRETSQTFPWRFLNPDRTSVLDIDTDIESKARDNVVQALKDTYGTQKVSKVLTLQTEKARSAIQTAGRSLGLDNDLTAYIASLIIFDRGIPRSLHTMYYGNDDYAPVPEFVREMDNHPDLWNIAQKIENLICGSGSHAGGILISDTPLTDSVALMKTNSGDIISQYDLHMCEKVSLIKIDLLSIDALDKIHATLNLLLDAGKIEWQGDLKSTYIKYVGVYNIERTNHEMWKMIWDHKVLSLFQMEKQSGVQAISLVKPESVDSLAVVNSVIRLMPQTPDAEIPLQKYARFHENIQNWYDEMTEAGLTQEEQNLLKPILTISSGICEAQERFMQIVQIPECGGFSLTFADSLRRAIAKKNPKAYLELEQEYFKTVEEKGLSKNLTNYVWNTLIAVSRGYSFNLAHCLAYSLIGLQELSLAWRYGTLYWSTGCLISDSGAYDEDSNTGTNYGRLGIAVARMQHEGVTIANPDINIAEFSFKPDEENNQILYALKAINSINTEIAQTIITNRPYTSISDFATRMLDTKIIKNSQMLMLIKAGCFLNLHSQDRAETMGWYLRRYQYKETEKLTLAQMGSIQEYDIIPENLKICVRILNFKRYVLSDEGLYDTVIIPDKKVPQCGYHDRLFILDDPSQQFFIEHFSEESINKVINSHYVISEKRFTKETDKLLQSLKDWFVSDEATSAYNKAQFDAIWSKYASGNEAHWSMQALTCYDQKHELDGVDFEKYGIIDYFGLPEEPPTYDYYFRYINGEQKKIPKYTIYRIAGTVLDADSNHHTISLLTPTGTVNCKLPKGQFAHYNRRLSQVDETGAKRVVEESWFKRGTLLAVVGIRQNDSFRVMNYTDTIYKHSCERILEIHEDGTLLLQAERAKI